MRLVELRHELTNRFSAHLLDWLEKRLNSEVDILDDYVEDLRPVLPKITPVKVCTCLLLQCLMH